MKNRYTILRTLFLILIGTALLSSCRTPEKVVYFQDLKPGESEVRITAPVDIRIRQTKYPSS